MIKSPQLIKQLEDEFLLKENLSLKEKFKQMDELFKECIALNKNILNIGEEHKDSILELARILNSCSKK